ncbi:MAG: PAS domain S-box protein [Acidobacteriota bacterium]
MSFLQSLGTDQDDLRVNERQFRAITERAPDAIVVVDEQGRIVLVNIQTERLFGYSRDEILGKAVEILVPQAARGNHVAHRDRYTADPHFRKMGEGLELKGLHKDGTEFPIEISLSPVLTPGGQWVASSIRDISVRKQMELQLQHSKDRFESLLESAPDGMLVVNERGVIVFANAQAEALFGYTRQELIGAGLWLLLPQRARANHDNLVAAFMESGRARQMGPGMDLSGLRKDGSEFPVEISLSPIRGVDEHWVCAAVRDVTQRRQVECQVRESSIAIRKLNAALEARIEERTGELQESENRFRLLVEKVEDYAILMLDNDGMIVTWNVGAERITGFSAEEAIGRHFSIFDPSANLPAGATAMLQQAAANGHCTGQGWRLRHNGARFWANVVVSAVQDDSGRQCGFSAVTQDITARKLAMDELEAERERAEEANRTKSDFLAVMSHEIRTPMNAILGMADLLYESSLTPEQRQYVEIFRRAGMNLLTLLNDLLDVAKIEAGHLALDQSDFNLEEMAEQVIELVASRARTKGIGLHLCILPGVPAALIGDSMRLRQVLLNLLGNAIKFTEAGEVVLTIAHRAGPGPVPLFEFSVRDTGIGIEPGQLDSIFDDFTQGDASTTRKYGGSGLGLSISWRLVHMMGGELTVNSQAGRGSEFRFTVPIVAAMPAESGQQADLADLAALRALIIDGSSTNRLILRATLQTWGMHTEEFASVHVALENLGPAMASSRPYSLILLGQQINGMDGFEAGRAIHSMAPEVPILLLSSDANPGDEQRCTEAGIYGHAALPLRRADLLQLVRSALGAGTGSTPPSSRPTLVPPQNAATAGSLRLLVAEDSEDNRMVIRLYLAKTPHRLVFAEDGERALHEFDAAPFDLIIMDIQMPVMDGLSAARAIRSAEVKRGVPPTPIVALSANAREVDIYASLSAGCNAHLSKPISKSALISAIGRYSQPAPSPDPSSSDCYEELRELFGDYLKARRAELQQMAVLTAVRL